MPSGALRFKLVCMRTWVAVWIFPAGVVGSLALLVQSSWITDVLALVWAFALVPFVTIKLLRRVPGISDQLRDLETNYWRTEPR